MKIIHTADIHLDSPLQGVADGNARRAELLGALGSLSQIADNLGAAAIIVAGDLFDDQFVTQMTVTSVAQIINSSKAKWFVLRGNHGNATPYKQLQKLCRNAAFFGEEWSRYSLGNVTVIGRELGHEDARFWQSFSCDKSTYNILVLHGDLDADTYGYIDKKAIAEQCVNYVALGHRHAFAPVKFGRVKGCYSGVLEPRGFDEAAITGFVVVDTDTDTVTFQPHYNRRVETLQIDVSGLSTDFALEQKILDAIATVSPRNYINVEFVGTLNEDVRLPLTARRVLEGRFFALRIKDKTTSDVDFEALKKEVSLRGEFVKLALQIADEKERDEVLRCGLAALNGEDS